ncbi:MAG: C10 family peptidase [Phycisphaerales bacterium]|nr:MAG: C10 family peptidase [Phycisphaerales bacterium]
MMAPQRRILCVTLVVVSLCAGLWAAPMTPDEAELAVVGWLGLDPAPLGTALAATVRSVEPYTDEGGRIIYYVVSLEPTGFVVVAADDLVEPIIAFAAEGQYDPSERSTVGSLVKRDLAGRMLSAPAKNKKSRALPTTAGNPHTEKWRKLKAAAAGKGAAGKSRTSISDVRVAPFTKTKWAQGSVCGRPCYNYYTPNNYPAGCVATAMAQLMYYHWDASQHLENDYAWSQMVPAPNCDTTDAQRQAIGRLCADAGAAADMEYRAENSGSNLDNAAVALRETFNFSNAIFADKYNWVTETEENIGAGLTDMLNANLDAGYPVLLAVTGDGGHAVVVDGYGYHDWTLYHHLNVGPEYNHDACNIWYNLNIPNRPDVDIPGGYTYDTIVQCTYNVFTDQVGEIISGRVTTSAGHPIAEAQVQTAVDLEYYNPHMRRTVTTTLILSDTTDAKGVYALVGVPSGHACTVSVAKERYDFGTRTVTVGTSMDDSAVSGNKWAINFEGTRADGGPIAVLWDLYHGVCNDGYLPSEGYGDLLELLEPRGYNVSTTTLGVQSEDLSAYDILVIGEGTAWDSSYSSAEVATIRTFVEGGGGLLIMGDHPRCPNHLRRVAMDYGFVPAVDEAWEGDVYVTDFSSHVIFDGCSELYLRVAGHIGFTPGRGTIEAWDDDRHGVVGTAFAGAGRVVITADCDFCRESYISHSDNKTFSTNVFDWLAGLL